MSCRIPGPVTTLATAAVLSVVGAAAVKAEDLAALAPVLAGFQSDDPEEVLAAGYAACLSGQGVAKTLDALWTGSGWTRHPEPEMGAIVFVKPESLGMPFGQASAMIWDKDGFCMVEHQGVGTDAARRVLGQVLTTAGYASAPVDPDAMCQLIEVASGPVVEITSSGQDPACDMDTDSAARFQWWALQ